VLYLCNMVQHYTEHMLWHKLGFVPENDFIPKTLDDVYAENLYCLSWFYSGVYPFDSWEADFDEYLRREVQATLNVIVTSFTS